MKTNTGAVCGSLAALFLAASLAVPAHASSFAGRVFSSTPTANCQSALPVFDGVIRKRPRAVANEGSQSAFITCAWTSQGDYSGNETMDSTYPTLLAITLGSLDGLPKTISCTVVPGGEGYTLRPSVTKTISTAGSGTLVWTPDDFSTTANLPSALVSASCNLPPGSAIYRSQLNFSELIP